MWLGWAPPVWTTQAIFQSDLTCLAIACNLIRNARNWGIVRNTCYFDVWWWVRDVERTGFITRSKNSHRYLLGLITRSKNSHGYLLGLIIRSKNFHGSSLQRAASESAITYQPTFQSVPAENNSLHCISCTTWKFIFDAIIAFNFIITVSVSTILKFSWGVVFATKLLQQLIRLCTHTNPVAIYQVNLISPC